MRRQRNFQFLVGPLTRASSFRACAEGALKSGNNLTYGAASEIFSMAADTIEHLETKLAQAKSHATYQRACESHSIHQSLGLDLNQPAEQREFHREQARRAEGVILELFDTEGD